MSTVPNFQYRIIEGDFTDGFLPVFDLVPIFIRAGFNPAVPAGDLGVGSPAVQLGAAPAKYTF